MNSNNIISLLISLLLLLIMSTPAIADGLVSNGHINGPHTDLTLTRDQIVALDHGQKIITLTAEQRKQLAHLRHSSRVKQLRIFPKTVETCTCELVNVAIRVSKTSIEVADELFGRDLIVEDFNRQLWTKREAEEKQKMKREKQNQFSSKIQLTKSQNQKPANR
jgi:hypothetical protein